MRSHNTPPLNENLPVRGEDTIKYDGLLNISVGKHRTETNWKKQKLLWSELVSRMGNTQRTTETHTEYLALKKDQQAERKDVGGFVGGSLAAGKRRATSVLNRCLLTLDIDFGKTDFWEDFTLVYGCAAFMYSTHAHSNATPRYRLVIPLSREVFPDEYQAIGRKVAGTIGIELFDPTTFQPERLMYWASTSKDGEFVAEFQDGPWLDADKVLNEYQDWKDTSQWPVSEKVDKLVKRSMQKQGDPLEKTGVVGAFCRTYSITEVIDRFLPDVYTPTSQANRFTYKEGTTAAGLALYEDKWAYSHHSTDPISGKLCNAFDLVRLHLFGIKDEDIREGTPVVKFPSYTAMIEYAVKDREVRKLIGEEKIKGALSDFEGAEIEADEKINTDWLAELEIDKKGNYLSSIKNVLCVLENAPELKDKIVYDEFEKRLIVTANLPWRKTTPQTNWFSDEDFHCLEHHLEGMQIPYSQLERALWVLQNKNKKHPVRDRLNKTRWDGVERLSQLLITYLGADNSEYTKQVTRKTLIGAVARVFNPGCKFDTVMVLVGPKGIFKSELIKRLAGVWFSDTMGDIHDKSGMENLNGVWIMEIAEWDAFKRADIDAIKRFITSQQDMYRPAYGKQITRYLRQCIFIGTTNRIDFLHEADERRFLPILCRVQEPTQNLWDHLTEYEISQIWAEAAEAYKSGESTDLSADIKAEADKIRGRHAVKDDREGLIDAYLEKGMSEDWAELDVWQRQEWLSEKDTDRDKIQRTTVSAAEIWCECLKGQQKDMNNANTKFIHAIMRQKKDWELSGNVQVPRYGKQRVYKRVGTLPGTLGRAAGTLANNTGTLEHSGTLEIN